MFEVFGGGIMATETISDSDDINDAMDDILNDMYPNEVSDLQNAMDDSKIKLHKMSNESSQNEMKTDQLFDKIDNQHFDDKCSSISSCFSINRIVQYLILHQQTKPTDVGKIFNKDAFPYLTNDFNHVLEQHLGDKKPINETRQEFELIHEYISSKIEKCKLESCTKFERNNRNRETQNILLADKNTDMDKNVDVESEYYIEVMDTMHCFLIHSFDVGFRIRSGLINVDEQKENDDDDDDDDDDNLHKDVIMEQLSNILKPKRERLQNIRGHERTTKTKFVTDIIAENENKENDDCKNDQETGSYSFGHRYDYWEKKANNYVAPKYSTLYDEILNNNIFTIDHQSFISMKHTAKQKLGSEYSKKLAANDYSQFLGMQENTPISLQHLLSVLLYTNFDSLSHQFSATFRSLNKTQTFEYCKKRNQEYAIWSRLLTETVNLFGTQMWDSEIKKYYHGVNCLLLFSSFVTDFNAPTSMTTQLAVAAIFAKQKGAILEIKKDFGVTSYFNCCWLSTYSNEDERLYFRPLFSDHFQHRVMFHSIRSVANNHDYLPYIHALTSYNLVINGDYLRHGYKVTKKDIKIVKKLINDVDERKQYKNKFPKYINNMFHLFVEQINTVVINMSHMDYYYPLMKPLFLDEYSIKINDICNVIKNCQQITIRFKRFKGDFSLFYFLDLLPELEKLSNNNNKKTFKRIEFEDIQFDDWDAFNSYESKFTQLNWRIEINTAKDGICFKRHT